ncbi:pseudouridine synthase [Cytophagaceae bacterium ABcell3]|nr:pseudouridine synthase [Cytophagaceae bacterium ABcell3]
MAHQKNRRGGKPAQRNTGKPGFSGRKNTKPGKSDQGKPERKVSKLRALREENISQKNNRSSNFRKSPNFRSRRPAAQNLAQQNNSDEIRLNKYIANAGICSRRDADELIIEGRIKVNDQVVNQLGYKVKPTDKVQYKNKSLRPERPIYLLLNKPKDFITTLDDPDNRKTVMDLVGRACKERIFPVGRLDRNTTGLLLMTNDGELAQKLTHPSKRIKKIYHVRLSRPIAKNHFELIKAGINLEDGPVKPDDIEIISADKKELGIEVHEGRNRLIRRIFEHFEYDIQYLDRVMYAGLTKKDLPRGKFRFLDEREIGHLKMMS